MAGVGGCGGRAGGTCLGHRARVSLSYGPSAGISIFPEGLSAGPGQPPGVSAGLGVSARVCAGHLCKLVHAWTGPDVAARACVPRFCAAALQILLIKGDSEGCYTLEQYQNLKERRGIGGVGERAGKDREGHRGRMTSGDLFPPLLQLQMSLTLSWKPTLQKDHLPFSGGLQQRHWGASVYNYMLKGQINKGWRKG